MDQQIAKMRQLALDRAAKEISCQRQLENRESQDILWEEDMYEQILYAERMKDNV